MSAKPKSPVKLSLAIVGIVIALCVTYSARESLLVGVIKFGVYVDSPVICKIGFEGVTVCCGQRKDTDLLFSKDLIIAKARKMADKKIEILLPEGETLEDILNSISIEDRIKSGVPPMFADLP